MVAGIGVKSRSTAENIQDLSANKKNTMDTITDKNWLNSSLFFNLKLFRCYSHTENATMLFLWLKKAGKEKALLFTGKNVYTSFICFFCIILFIVKRI